MRYLFAALAVLAWAVAAWVPDLVLDQATSLPTNTTLTYTASPAATRTVTFGAATDGRVQVDTRVQVGESVVTDSATLAVDTALPVVESGRVGLVVFPPGTQRRSYPYFDVMAQETVLLDYAGETTVGALTAYEFVNDDFRVAVEPLTGVMLARPHWDEQTRAQQYERVLPVLRLARGMQILEWLAGASAVVLGGLALVKEFR